MDKSFQMGSLVLSVTVLLLLGAVVAAADQASVMPNQGSDYRVLEEEGLELEPIVNNSGNNGAFPRLDSIPPEGVLLIPESTGDVVGMYDPFDGTFLGNLIDGSGLFSTPINAIQGPDGNIYVSDQVADAVFVYDTTGTYLYTYADASDGLDNIRGIDFRNDTLFVTTIHAYVARFAGPHNRISDFFVGAGAFDIHFLDDGRSLLGSHASPNGVRLYDVDGTYISQIINISFPEQVHYDDLEPGDFLSAAFSDNLIYDFDLSGTIYQTTPLTYPRGVYRLGNGNILATNSGGVYELDPGSGNVIQQENTGSGRFIELYKPQVTGEPGAMMGTVTDLQMNPIEGAIVAVRYRRDTTDASGSYFFDLYPGTYTASASAEYHNPVTIEDIVIVENETTTVDFALPTPLINVDTSPVELEVDSGEVVTVTRNVANVGDGELEFSVDLSIGEGILSVRPGSGVGSFAERILRSREELMSTASERSPTYKPGHLPTILDFSDSVFFFDVQVLNNDTQNLGLEFDGAHFWVTGGNSGGEPNKLYKFSSDGSALVATYNQSSSPDWGWRDLAWDGEYLYGSDSYSVIQIDTATGMATGVTIPGPINPCRALAYDPDADHFWTASFTSSIYEFNRSGNTINTYSNSNAVYGMAWDDVSPDGPWLWVYSQDGVEPIESLISQFDPRTGTYTGISFFELLPAGYDSTVAGGACFSTDHPGIPGLGVLFTLNQGYPTDWVTGYEITTYSRWLIVDPMSGILQPAENVDLDITIDFTGENLNYDSCYQATLTVSNNTPDTPQIPISVNCITGVEEVSGLPREFSVAQNYPNPFNARTNISFALPQQSDVKVEVYNLLGQKTATIAEGLMPAGNHTVTWDASDVASGVYYYRVSAGDYSAIRMMTLLK